MDKSKIEWTDSTWNPITGCDKVSNGCQHCYAERMAERLRLMGSARYQQGFKLRIHEDLFNVPLTWTKPRTIFVNSMSDLFHEQVPFDVIKKIFKVMEQATWHRFQILTKRPMQLLRFGKELPWPENVWMGVTVESDRYLHRIRALQEVPAKVKFVSFEPLLSDIPESTDLRTIDWAIVGGESGPGARPMMEDWASSIQRICERDEVLFFFKQWGGVNKKKAGREFKGKIWDDMPSSLGAINQQKITTA